MEKKLIYFSENCQEFLTIIKEISKETKQSESRIIEDCMLYGFCLLYGNENNIDMLTSVLRKRYGNIIDSDKIKSLINWSFQEASKQKKSLKHSPETPVLDSTASSSQFTERIDQESAQKVVEHVKSIWSRDFLNPHGWCPEVKEKKGFLIVDGYPVCPVKDIKEVSCDLTNLYLITDAVKYNLHVHQSLEGSPAIDNLDVSKLK